MTPIKTSDALQNLEKIVILLKSVPLNSKGTILSKVKAQLSILIDSPHACKINKEIKIIESSLLEVISSLEKSSSETDTKINELLKVVRNTYETGVKLLSDHEKLNSNTTLSSSEEIVEMQLQTAWENHLAYKVNTSAQVVDECLDELLMQSPKSCLTLYNALASIRHGEYGIIAKKELENSSVMFADPFFLLKLMIFHHCHTVDGNDVVLDIFNLSSNVESEAFHEFVKHMKTIKKQDFFTAISQDAMHLLLKEKPSSNNNSEGKNEVEDCALYLNRMISGIPHDRHMDIALYKFTQLAEDLTNNPKNTLLAFKVLIVTGQEEKAVSILKQLGPFEMGSASVFLAFYFFSCGNTEDAIDVLQNIMTADIQEATIAKWVNDELEKGNFEKICSSITRLRNANKYKNEILVIQSIIQGCFEIHKETVLQSPDLSLKYFELLYFIGEKELSEQIYEKMDKNSQQKALIIKANLLLS